MRNPDARLAGLANISLGRYISEMKKQSEEDDKSFDITKFSKSDFNKQTIQKKTTPFIPDEPITCVVDIIEPFNGNDFAIVLRFNNVEFLSDTFNKIDAPNSYMIPVNCKGKSSYLFIKTTGDIFEYEIVYSEKAGVRLFYDESYVPKLLKEYNSLSMEVVLNDEIVIVTYKKRSKK